MILLWRNSAKTHGMAFKVPMIETNFFPLKIMGKCVNMNTWYEKLAKIWIFNRKIKFKVTCFLLKSGEL